MTSKFGRFLKFGKTLMQKLVSSLRRFPETLLMCAATAVVLIILNHAGPGADGGSGELLKRLAAVLALGIPLSLCLRVYFERTALPKMPLKILIHVAAAAGLVLYYCYLLKDFGTTSMLRYAAVSLALYLAFTFIPYFYRRQNYELYVIYLFTSFLITYLFAAVLFGGLSAILGTINHLFSARIPGNTYLDIWLIVAAILAPAFFLADIPEKGRDLESEAYPKVLIILLSYIVVPLILAYSVILYAYFIKILVLRHWPEIMVSHLVLWYAIFSTLVAFLIYPLSRANRWIGTFTAHFPKMILPLLALMFVAMGVRVGAYGVTEYRYLVLAAGLWVAGAMLYLVISKKPRNVFLPASLALVAVLAVFGPWSAFSLSVLSQNRRFEKIAAEHNLIQGGRIVKPAAAIPEAARREMSSIILYFEQKHELADLQALPEGFSRGQVEVLLGFPLDEYPMPDEENVFFHYALGEKESNWDISGYDYLMGFSSAGQHYRAGNLEVSYSPANNRLRIMEQGEEIYSRNIAGFVRQLHQGNAGKSREMLPRDELTFPDSGEGLKVLYGFTRINGWENLATGTISMDYLEFFLFINREQQGDQ